MSAILIALLALASHPAQQAADGRLWSGDEVTFLVRPVPTFPENARSNRGEAWVVCAVKADGGFRSCEIESETPRGNGFGRAAVASMQRRARVAMSADGPSEGDRVRAHIGFRDGR